MEAMENPQKWRKMWKTKAQMNGITNREYNWMNKLILAYEKNLRGFESDKWITFNQAKKIDIRIKSEECKLWTMVYFWTFLEDKKAKAQGEDKSIPMLKTYLIYNEDQLESKIPVKAKEIDDMIEPEIILDKDQIVHWYIARENIKFLEGGDRCFYRQSEDMICMPKLQDFFSSDEYYASFFHEMVHSTGAKTRLNRLSDDAHFGNTEYSKEELVAEFGACFVAQKLSDDIYINENSLAYLSSRAKEIRADNKQAELFNAISKAEKACQFILK